MSTRSSKKRLIKTKKTNNEKFKRSVTYLGAKLWNSLPPDTQKMDHYQIFKSSLLNHLTATEVKVKNVLNVTGAAP